jgi:hypothetical protein
MCKQYGKHFHMRYENNSINKASKRIKCLGTSQGGERHTTEAKNCCKRLSKT